MKFRGWRVLPHRLKIKTQRANIVLGMLFTFFFLLFSLPVGAQYGQYGTYQAPLPSKTVLIDKMIGQASVETKGGTATASTYVDNLSPSDARFHSGEGISFRIKVKNTSDETLNDVIFKDFLPSYVEPVKNPGTYDSSSRTITVNLGSMAAQEEKIMFFTMNVVNQDQLPQDKSIVCVTNKAQVYNNEVSDDDNAQFCIEKQVGTVTQQPSSGPEMGLGLLALQFAGLGIGFYIRKQR